MENVMALHLQPFIRPIVALAIIAALQLPVRAEENPTPPPVQVPAQAPVQAPAQTSPAETSPAEAQPSQRQESGMSGLSDDRRFVFHRIDGDILRLDMRTGAIARCSPNGAGWTCVPGREERDDFEREIARLRRDNAILKNALLERGVPLPEGMAPNPPAAGGADEPIPRPPQTVPPTVPPETRGASSSGEAGGIMDAVEKNWRRFVEMMTNLQRDLQKKD
jgi:hypothetical protein